MARSLEETVTLLHSRSARTVYIDGGKVIQEFLRNGLVDEFTITRAPVLIAIPARPGAFAFTGVWWDQDRGAGLTSSSIWSWCQ